MILESVWTGIVFWNINSELHHSEREMLSASNKIPKPQLMEFWKVWSEDWTLLDWMLWSRCGYWELCILFDKEIFEWEKSFHHGLNIFEDDDSLEISGLEQWNYMIVNQHQFTSVTQYLLICWGRTHGGGLGRGRGRVLGWGISILASYINYQLTSNNLKVYCQHQLCSVLCRISCNCANMRVKCWHDTQQCPLVW